MTTPRFMRRHWACPECGQIVPEIEINYRKPFKCGRCSHEMPMEEFLAANGDKWSDQMRPEDAGGES